MTPRYFDKKNLIKSQKKDLSKFESDDQVTLLYNFGFAKTNSEKAKVAKKTTKKSQVVQENLLELEKIRSWIWKKSYLFINFLNFPTLKIAPIARTANVQKKERKKSPKKIGTHDHGSDTKVDCIQEKMPI